MLSQVVSRSVRSGYLVSSAFKTTLKLRRFSSAPVCAAAKEKSVEALARRTETANSLEEVGAPESLIGPGGKDGEIPSDMDQLTGLERLEMLGDREGINVFDMRPLDTSRRGTMTDPIVVDSYEPFRYVGCTGSPGDSHAVLWLKPTVDTVARCWECGSVYIVNDLTVPTAEPVPH